MPDGIFPFGKRHFPNVSLKIKFKEELQMDTLKIISVYYSCQTGKAYEKALNDVKNCESVSEIAAVLLGCSSSDLQYCLGEMKYDIPAIICTLVRDEDEINLKNIMHCAGLYAAASLDMARKRLLSRAEMEVDGVDEDGIRMCEDLRNMNPRFDLNCRFNFMDTEYEIVNRPLYEKYLPDELDYVEDMLGFDIRDDEDR